MALPQTVSGADLTPAQNSFAGPFKSSGGAFYFLSRAGDLDADVFKNTDPGTNSWSTITGDIEHGRGRNAYQVGDTIHYASQIGGDDVVYSSFSLSSETWTAQESVDSPANTGTNDPEAVDIVVRSDGDILVFYQGEAESIGGTDYARVEWAVSTDGGSTWTLKGPIVSGAGLEVDCTGPRAVLGDSDTVHLVFRGNAGTTTTGDQLMSVAIASNDTVQTVRNTGFNTATIAYPIGQGVSFDRNGTTKLRFPYKNDSSDLISLEFDAATDPSSFSTSQISADEPATIDDTVDACMAVDGSQVQCLFVKSTDSDLYRSDDADADSWATPSSLLAGTVSAVSGTVYSHNSSTVLAYVFDDAGTVKYDEAAIEKSAANTLTAQAGVTASASTDFDTTLTLPSTVALSAEHGFAVSLAAQAGIASSTSTEFDVSLTLSSTLALSATGGGTKDGAITLDASLALSSGSTGGVASTSTPTTLRYSDRDWIGSPTDADRANVYYQGRLIQPFSVERTLPLLPEPTRRVQRQFGEIVIANGDGALDDTVRDVAIDGREIRLFYGPYFDEFKEFGRIANVVGVSWTADDTVVRIQVRGRTFLLERPLQENLYAGTGDEEGGDDLEGKPKPQAFGKIRNIAPVLIDPVNLIYQFHDGSAESIDAVRDRGAELTLQTGDRASYDELVAETVTAGAYVTALDVGMFKLGALPSGLVTADVQGDNTGGYINTIDEIAIRILQDRAGIASSEIDVGSFRDLPVSDGEVGIFISHQETPTTEQVLNKLIATVAGFWGTARNGRLFAGRISNPATASSIITLDEVDIIALQPEQAPIPRKRQRVRYQPNWTVQRGEDLAGSVTAERRQFLTEPFRTVSSEDATVTSRHLNALDPPPLDTLYDDEADAQTLADFLMDLHKQDRRILSITVSRIAYQFFLGDVITVKWPRLGLSEGKKFVIIGMRENAGRDQIRLRLWG